MQKIAVLTPSIDRYKDLFKDFYFPEISFIFIGTSSKTPVLEEISRVEKILTSNQKDIDLVFGMSDRPSLIAALINEKFGLKATSSSSILKIQDKLIFLNLSKEWNIPIPEFVSVPADGDAPVLPFSYPAFAKPSRGSLSKNAERIDSEEELVSYKKSLRDNQIIIIQPYISSDQFTADFCVLDGNIKLVAITKTIYNSSKTSFYEFVTPVEDEDMARKVQKIAESIVSMTGIDRACINIEFFLMDDGKIIVIECNSRPSAQFIQIINYAKNISYLNLIIETSLGRTCGMAQGKSNREARIRVFRRDEDALVLKAPNVEKILNLKKIQEIKRLSN